ncbi:MAG: ATP-dependent DNA ligase [Acidimicrobiales bacterium]
MLLAEVVATSAAVAATASRSAKVAALAQLLRRLDPDEAEVVVAALTGQARQGRIGVGWSTVAALDVPPAPVASLSVGDLDRALTTLAAVAGPGSQAVRAGHLDALLRAATAEEQRFLGRLLLGELRQGALAGVVADAVAKAAGVPLALVRRAAMLAGDLPTVAAVALAQGIEGLAGISFTVGRFVQPMLAAPGDVVADALPASGGPASVEQKLDGARLQAHRSGEVVRLFTRNGNDVTGRLGAVADLVAALACASVVLDGEVIGLAEDERPERFQDTMARFGRHAGATPSSPLPEAAGSLTVRFFDCIHLDGEDLIDQPLSTRAAALDRVAGAWRVPAVVTDDPADAEAFLAAALAAGHEGVVVKDLASPYEAGRRGGAWRKVKPVRTLDLVVLAVEWGSGRRQGWLSNLHLGARDPAGGPPVMVGKTFKGLTDELLAWQTAALLEREVSRHDHVVVVRPELVVEIALDGAQRSTRYPGGVALRFARVRRYRNDRGPDDADTIDTVQAMLS